jgi:processing peptidase subunit alpha
MNESPHTNIILGYKSCSWKEEDAPIFFLMNTIMGIASVFSSGGPGKGMYCRAITHLMQRFHFIESVSTINSLYSDTGMFGIIIECKSDFSKDLLNCLMQEFHMFREPISDEELVRNKNILKMNIL